MPILRIAVAKPLRTTFDYLPPLDCDDASIAKLQPGTRIEVPFGRAQLVGILVNRAPESEVNQTKLKRATRIIDPISLLPKPLFELCLWASQYYAHPIGEVLTLAFPPLLRKGVETNAPHNAIKLTPEGRLAPQRILRSPKQAALIERLQSHEATRSVLKAEGFSSSIIKALIDKGLAIPCRIEDSEFSPSESDPQPSLSSQQQFAVAQLSQHAGFKASLLYGITGSGKTEVYLQTIANTIASGAQAMVLVPEIALTPQTAARFQGRFGACVGVLHSGLTETQRAREWERARTGKLQVLLGTRSALFTPFQNLGLIVVDEEHDSAYKQQDGFRYHARDLAVKRAQIEQCPIVLGSATPSLETISNVNIGRFEQYTLSTRAKAATLPSWQIIDVRQQSLEAGLSQTLINACHDTLGKGEQALLFLNRRGFAHTLLCHDCGWVAECDNCDSRMVIHKRHNRLRCHHCQAQKPLPETCPSCHSSHWQGVGYGTERAELALQSLFPHTPIHRIDSDTVGSASQLDHILGAINANQNGCLILGTQMLAKGHDLAKVTLVGIVDTDALLFSSDFRAEERLGQLLTQVSGRSGRGDRPGTVMLQTHHPDAEIFHQVIHQDYMETANSLLHARHQTGLPPFGQIVMVHADSKDPSEAERFLNSARHTLTSSLPKNHVLIGPLPAPLSKRAGKFRYQLTWLAPHEKNLHRFVHSIADTLTRLPHKSELSWAIDIDPHDFL